MISDRPYLPDSAIEKWRSEVARTNVMIEYGAGGSTVEAVRHVSVLLSVETDSRYLNAVAARLRDIDGCAAFHPVFVDIGLTWSWGLPVATRATQTRLAKWRTYPAAPWRELERLGAVPDLVFVDGRFRVACVLESLVRLPDGANCRFLMDDFVGREDAYGAVMDFITDVGYHDRMISFQRKDSFDRQRCAAMLEAFYSDYR